MHVAKHTENIIEVEHVTFGFLPNAHVLDDVCLAVHRGDYLGIVGPNGGGKTTLLKCMLGLIKPTKGTIRLWGQDIAKFRDWRRIGYVPQKATAVDQSFPVTVENVVIMGTYARRGLWRPIKSADHKKSEQALAHVDLVPYRDRLIGDLSGGQQQRVFIARALASEPDIIILDEPTVGVDAATQQQFYALLRKLNRQLGLTLILVSHDLDVIAAEATEAAYVNRTISYYPAPADVLRHDHDARRHTGHCHTT